MLRNKINDGSYKFKKKKSNSFWGSSLTSIIMYKQGSYIIKSFDRFRIFFQDIRKEQETI